MTLSLYAATIPTFLQILGSTRALIDKAESWRDEKGLSDAEILGWRLAADMFPFAAQIHQLIAHSKGAVAAVQVGVFSPDLSSPGATLTECRVRLDGAITALEALQPTTLNDLVGNDMRFEYGEQKMPFTTEEFLFTFSQPNFFFHAATAYGILRTKGLPIGKMDFMGAIRLNIPA